LTLLPPAFVTATDYKVRGHCCARPFLPSSLQLAERFAAIQPLFRVRPAGRLRRDILEGAGGRRAVEGGRSAAWLRLSTSIKLMTFSGVAVGDGVAIVG
jgi:hypothetical protein